MPLTDIPPPPAIIEKVGNGKASTNTIFKFNGTFAGATNKLAVPPPGSFQSPSDRVASVLENLSKEGYDQSILQKVAPSLTKWGNTLSPNDTTYKSIQFIKDKVAGEIITQDPIYALHNATKFTCISVDHQRVKTMVFQTLGRQGKFSTIIEQFDLAQKREQEIIRTNSVATPLFNTSNDKQRDLRGEALGNGIIGFLSSSPQDASAIGNIILQIPEAHRATAINTASLYWSTILPSFNVSPLSTSTWAQIFLKNKIHEAPKLLLLEPLGSKLPSYALDIIPTLGINELLSLKDAQTSMCPAVRTKYSETLDYKIALYRMIPGDNVLIDQLLNDPSLRNYEQALRTVISRNQAYQKIFARDHQENLLLFLRSLPTEIRVNIVEKAVRTSRLSSHFYEKEEHSNPVKALEKLELGQAAVCNLEIFKGKKVIIIAHNELLGDPTTTGSTLVGKIESLKNAWSTGDSHRFGKKLAIDIIEKLSGNSVILMRAELSDSSKTPEKIKEQSLQKIINTPPGEKGILILFDTHGSPSAQYLSSGSAGRDGTILHSTSAVSISLNDLEGALKARAKKFPESANLQNRTVIMLNSCKSYEFAKKIAEGPILSADYVSPLVVAAAENGQYGYSLATNAVGADLLENGLHLSATIAPNGTINRQPVFGDFDTPTTIGNPTVFAPYTILMQSPAQPPYKRFQRKSFQVY